MNDLAQNASRPASAFKLCASIGVCFCLTAVAIGAFGAHALSDVLVANQRESTFELANRYHFYHGLAMLALASVLSNIDENNSWRITVLLFLFGTLVFSGSLYTLALSNVLWLGAITPIGGVLLIVAWSTVLFRLMAPKKL